MYRLLVLATLCFSIGACGGGSGSNGTQTSPSSTSNIASYQGLYIGSIQSLDSRNSGGSVQVILGIDETGLVFGKTSDTTEAMIISFTRLNTHGQPQGKSIVNYTSGQQLIISYNGTIDLSSEGAFDITYTYSGTMTGSFRIYGTKPPIDVQTSASASTINLGETVTLYNISMMPGSLYPGDAGSLLNLDQFYSPDSLYPGDAGYLINPELFFSWSIKSAPHGSLATFISRNSDLFSLPFTPDMRGTYVITLTGHNGTGTATNSSDITINVI